MYNEQLERNQVLFDEDDRIKKEQAKIEERAKRKKFVNMIMHFVLHGFIILACICFSELMYDEFDFVKFAAFFTDAETKRNWIPVVVSIILMVCTVFFYFFYESRSYMEQGKNIEVVFIIIELSFLTCSIMGKYVSLYARPTAFCALLILLLVNKRTAIFINVIFCALMLMADRFTNCAFTGEMICYSFIIGLTTSQLAIYLVDNVGSRIKVFGTGFVIAIPITLAYLGLGYHYGMSVYEILFIVLHSFMSGILSVVLMMAVLPVFEALFNILTNYRLAELADHNSKLVKRLLVEAPGTFQHVLVVATLAETCAQAIGENPLLARTAAYYHDMGKLNQPSFFSENQSGFNPHDDLTPELSTQIIRSHTADGAEIIRKYHLPKILADVALQHHGTLPIQYFYQKALKFTENEIDIADYSYKGPKPQTKIAAIIMLADGAEAAVRAQNDRSHERVTRVVNDIVEDRLKKNDQFDECDITLSEIKIVQETLINSLSNVYHPRVKYIQARDKRFNAFESDHKDGKNGKS